MAADHFWKLNKGHLEFILLAAPADKLESMTGPIFDLAIDHEAEVDLLGTLVVMTYGTAGADSGIRGRRFQLVDALQKKFRNEIKMVHGAGFGHYGFVGGKGGGRFTFILPEFEQARAQLDRLSWGKVSEARERPT
jgi:hypothetical protein